MPSRTALTIGTFDGVHRGHQALLRAARSAVGREGRVTVLSFDPHPLTILRPEQVPAPLSDFEERANELRAAGADEVARLRPSRPLLRQPPEVFLADVVTRYRPQVVVEGPDFRFGRGRSGSVATLLQFGERHGFQVRIIEPVEAALQDQSLIRVSSSVIRWMLGRGRVADAAALLGRPHRLRRRVVQGDRRGRELGVPTANLEEGPTLVPADGIYAGRALGPDGLWYPAAISVGTKPTFGTHPRTCEAHLVGYEGPLDDYGWTIVLEFAEWLRDQLAYDSVEALIDQLHRDLAETAAIVGSPDPAASGT